MTDHSRQALVAAIGGTYISLAIADIDELTISDFALLNSADFEQPMDAVERYLKTIPRCPNKVGLAITGSVAGDKAIMDLRGWTVTKNDVRAATRADIVHMVTDLDALAIMLPHLSAYDVTTIKDGMPALHGTKIAVNAGTALGVSALVHGGGHWVPVVGQAGQSSFHLARAGEFNPQDGSSRQLVVDDVFTGRGLVMVYEQLARRRGAEPALKGARAIAAKGLAREDEAAIEALDFMAIWLGRYAADVALTFGAVGGIYLAGGLAANMLPVLNGRRFLDAIEEGIGNHLGEVAIRVVKTGADTGLRGAALALANSLTSAGSARRAGD